MVIYFVSGAIIINSEGNGRNTKPFDIAISNEEITTEEQYVAFKKKVAESLDTKPENLIINNVSVLYQDDD